MSVNDEATYTGVAPGQYQGLDVAQPMYVGSVPDFNNLPAGARFTSGYVGGLLLWLAQYPLPPSSSPSLSLS